MFKIIVKGIVQGVGFRPYIYRKAIKLGFVGTIKNIGCGVEIIINNKKFIHLLDDLPPLARIDDFKVEEISGEYSDFNILTSIESSGETILPTDIFMCDDCLKELKDPNDRRHNYYFITCTNCGPRFSMIKDFPYDRKNTSMDKFKMCNSCKEEYKNPNNRRFHAETIACKECGPKLILEEKGKEIKFDSDIEKIKKTVEFIKSGEIVAIKGVGGFHLVSNIDSINKIRKILSREDKPFALLAKDVNMIKNYCRVSKKEEELLNSPQRPIVILDKLGNDLYEVSELNSIGFMLPYTPIHHLLFDYLNEPIFMTSFNLPGIPMITSKKNIKDIDVILYHEREIINRVDDSVIKVIDENPLFLRRSRGYAPLPIKIKKDLGEALAVGSEINNSICISKGKNIFLSQHIGDTSKIETLNFHNETIRNFMKLSRSTPKKVVCDLHPDYETSINAEKLGLEIIKVQHHKAHVASVALEHGLKDYVGIAMDGTGYGEDVTVWGGEVFDVTNNDFERIGHLELQPMIGGDSSVENPKKMLFGILSGILDESELVDLEIFNEEESSLYFNQLDENFNITFTSSAGRVLDAVSALIGVCDKKTYDGRPAMLLESIATEPLELKPLILEKNGMKILMTTPLFKFLLDNLHKSKGELAATVQCYLANGLLEIAKSYKKPIVFSGGVAYNKMITKLMLDDNVKINKEIPPGDGGVCFGQIALNILED